MARIKTLAPLVPKSNGRTVELPPKQVDSLYQTPEYRTWRKQVIARAGRRCEDVEADGRRCSKAEPAHRMFADHIVEVRDGGARFDPANGKCRCGRHHTLKTTKVRAQRMGARGG